MGVSVEEWSNATSLLFFFFSLGENTKHQGNTQWPPEHKPCLHSTLFHFTTRVSFWLCVLSIYTHTRTFTWTCNTVVLALSFSFSCCVKYIVTSSFFPLLLLVDRFIFFLFSPSSRSILIFFFFSSLSARSGNHSSPSYFILLSISLSHPLVLNSDFIYRVFFMHVSL